MSSGSSAAWNAPANDPSVQSDGARATSDREGAGSLELAGPVHEDVPEEPLVRKPGPPLRRILVAVDLVALLVGWAVVTGVAIRTGEILFGPLTALAHVLLLLAAGAWMLSASGLYRRRICAIRSVEVARIGRVSLGLAVLTVVVLAPIGREAALLAGVAGGASWFLVLTIERGVLREWINARRAAGDFGATVLVVGGEGESTLKVAQFLAANPLVGFRVTGVSCPSPPQLEGSTFPWAGPPLDVCEQVRSSGATGMVLDSSSLTPDELSRIVRLTNSAGVHVHISSGLRGVDVRRINVSSLVDEAFLDVAPLGLTRMQVTLKRIVDVVGGGLALVVLSPLLLVAALAVWAQDRGPVLFRQERVGQNGERFELFKIRTMVMDAEQLKEELAEGNERMGPLFKLGHDPRVTPVGRFLRASSIDEIPQLFNVLMGYMSLVGPRPALPDEVAQFDDDLITRLTVKPGITGLWQVEARDLPSFDLYRRYDLLYVQNWSLGVDLAVIARTLVVVALRAGAAVLPARLRPAGMRP